jgi:hypothetical protein
MGKELSGHNNCGVPLVYAETEAGKTKYGHHPLINGIPADCQYHFRHPTPVLGVYSRSGLKMLKLWARLPHLKGIVDGDNRLRALDDVTFNISLK